eukprot:TRINITY_DN3554_c3_g1_i1.p1 TRINITY_DN3554_c3_g1~~TRINITY_DN3554_c3_g1_i1.p1  ORF type:complete len:127 (+),score=18.60 TRINITY_DN3554_c3_g1_i1:49-381(+)
MSLRISAMKACMFTLFIPSVLANSGAPRDADLNRMFQELDTDGDGFLWHQELRNWIQREATHEKHTGKDYADREAKQLVLEFDKDGDGLLSKGEFDEIMHVEESPVHDEQ